MSAQRNVGLRAKSTSPLSLGAAYRKMRDTSRPWDVGSTGEVVIPREAGYSPLGCGSTGEVVIPREAGYSPLVCGSTGEVYLALGRLG